MTRAFSRFPLHHTTAGLVLAALLSSTALAQPPAPPPAQPPAEAGPAPMMREQAGPAVALPHGRMLDRLLDEVKASAEQREQVRRILQSNRPQGGREEALAKRDQLLQAFVTVDAKAAEAARQQLMAHHEAATRRDVQVLLEIAKVLSPEQRKLWVERMKQQGRPSDDRDSRPAGAQPGRPGDGLR